MNKQFEVITLKLDDNTVCLAHVARMGGEHDVSISEHHIDGVMDAVREISRRLHIVLEAVKPQEASVEFGIQLAAKSGKLAAMLIEGSGDASFKITMKWKNL